MSDYMETIWEQFGVETEEHIEQIESLLIQAEAQSVDADGIAQLFRSFHSLKGLAKALDLSAMEAVAHKSEDILGLVRDGTIGLEEETVSLLLEALDVLKVLCGQAVSARADGERPEALIDRLARHFADAAHVREPDDAPDTAAGGDTSLHSDADMLRFYTELLKEHVPHLACLMSEDLSVHDAARVEQAIGSLDTLQHASDAMEFQHLVEVIAALRELSDLDSRADAASQHVERIERFVELIDMVDHIETVTALETGGRDLAELLFSALQKAVVERFDTLLASLTVLADDDQGDALEQAAATVVSLAASCYGYLSFMRCEGAGQLMLVLEDLFNRVRSEQLFVHRELLELGRQLVSTARQLQQDQVSGARDSASCDGEAQALIAQVRKLVWAGDGGEAEGETTQAVLRQLLEQFAVKPELVEILTPENVRDLMEAIQGGAHLYEVLAHLESSESVTQRFMAWVGQAGTRAITNRTVFIDDQTWYEFLVTSGLPPDEFLAQAHAVNGTEGSFVTASACGARPATPAAAKSGAGSEAKAQPSQPQKSTSVIRVQGETLDQFMTQIGEMVSVHGMLSHALHDDGAFELLRRLEEALAAWRQDGATAADGDRLQRLLETTELLRTKLDYIGQVDLLLHSALGRLQESALELRVVPIENVFKRLPRVVRDLAQAQGKQVRLEMAGQDVSIDKAMVDVLVDPLIHMVRNSVDHGVEAAEARQRQGKPAQAVISLRAQQRGNQVVVQIGDDGAGIDVEAVRRKAVEKGLVPAGEIHALSDDEVLQFIFHPGFSTAKQVTETSGRGVGMDVVRTNLTRMGGNVRVESEPGVGSNFWLQLPLSAAIQETLLVEVGGQCFAVPTRYISEIIEVEPAMRQQIKGREAIVLREQFLPIVSLGDLLGLNSPMPEERTLTTLILSNEQHRIGLVIERILRRQELFVKDIHPELAALPGVGGASTLGDGRVVLILDSEDLFTLAVRLGGAPRALRGDAAGEGPTHATTGPRDVAAA